MTSSARCCCRQQRQRQRQQRHVCRTTMSSTTTTTRAMLSSAVLLLGWMLVVGLLPPVAVAQSNYVSHANNVEYRGEGLPEEATLDGKVTKLDDLSPIIFLNRTKAALNCAAGSMQVEMKFNEPFFGLAYADFDRNSACQIIGKGELAYKLELPLKGCGTKQEPQRVFTNNIVVRFHPGLEMDGDEIVTIVCRYPPPLAPPPAGLPAPILNPIVPASLEPPLRGATMLFIICGIVFMTLMLLGLGVSYHCLRRRTIPVVRRLPMSMGSGSEITRLSGSSLGNISHFEGLKIPRAHAPLATVNSLSGSDGPLASDTLPSDYPSESHSEQDCDVDTRSLPVSSAGSFDNRAYVQDNNSSIYSEHYGHTQEFQTVAAAAAIVHAGRHPLAVREPSPKFDVQVRVKRAPPPPPATSSSSSASASSGSSTISDGGATSPASSDTESVATITRERNNLSTIMESHEDRESVLTIDSMPHTDVAHSHFTYVPELHRAPHRQSPAPLQHQTVVREHRTTHESSTQQSGWPHEDYADGPARSLASVGTERNDNYSMVEMTDYPHRYADERYHTQTTTTTTSAVDQLPEPPIVVKRQPEITSHVVDDVFLRTITEKKTIEDIEKYKQRVTEYKSVSMAPQPPTLTTVSMTPPPPAVPQWDVTIRASGGQPLPPQWENFSDISSVTSLSTHAPPPEPLRAMSGPPPQFIQPGGKKLTSPELVGNMKPIEMPVEDKSVPNWDVLIRVLEQQELDDDEEYGAAALPDDVSSVHSATTTTANMPPLQRQLSYDDRLKWKEIITTESSLRSMLTEAVVREDFERIRSDTRYERIFEPQTWEVLIRILAPPDDDIELRGSRNGPAGAGRPKKKEAWDTRSRRSSLPTLYEYDSDGGSSVRTITLPADLLPLSHRGSVAGVTFHPGSFGGGGGGGSGAGGGGSGGGAPSRRTSRSSYRSDNVDMRSMTEVMVDFARPDHFDNASDASSLYPNRYYDDEPYERRSMHRTLSQPSLARSASEFTERWIVPHPQHDADNEPMSSPDVTPRPVRSVRVMGAPSATPHRSSPNVEPVNVVQSTSSQYAEQRSTSQTTTDADGNVSTRRDWYSYAKKK